METRSVLTELEKGLIFDGAMGSILIDAGLAAGRASESWVIERPVEVKKVHTAFAMAGAEVITTCTFGGNRLKLKAAGLADNIEAINRQAARLARDSAENKRFVTGNIGPTGQLLMPNGPLSEKEAQKTYAEQAGILSQNGVDFFTLATFYDLQEMTAAIQGVRSVSELPVFASMTFQETEHGYYTMMGNPVTACMTAMLEAGAAVVGANCTLDSERMIALAQVIRRVVNTPILIFPNAGSLEINNSKPHYTEDADTFAENMLRIKSLGVEAIGGCCGTTPTHIRHMSEKIHQHFNGSLS